jgi:hypothetical protein
MMRFTAAPGWPPTPPGWQPPVGWVPPPDWPPAPHGWQFWQDDGAPARPWMTRGGIGVLAGGALVAVAAAVPFVEPSADGQAGLFQLKSSALATSAVFGVVIAVLGLCMLTRALGVAIAALALAALGVLGYAAFLAVGLTGFTTDEDFGAEVRYSWDPGAGLVLSLAGCVLAAAAAVLALRRTG